MCEEVTYYLNDVLKPKLKSCGADEEFINYTLTVIERQMYSALNHINDGEFFNTLSLIVSEEAPFYQPDAPTEVKSFVVLTVRNSPFESFQSKDYKKAGLTKPLSDSEVIKITSEAVKYFSRFDLKSLSVKNCENDVYETLSLKYPTAWNALKNLACSPANICDFQPFTLPVNIKISAEKIKELNNNIDVKKDGFDETVEPLLAERINYSVTNGVPFFVDSFKFLSRNPKLLLSVIEELLAKGTTFATCNYYLTNGHVERRKNVIKAAHNEKEFRKHLTNLNGISPSHRKILIGIREELNGNR